MAMTRFCAQSRSASYSVQPQAIDFVWKLVTTEGSPYYHAFTKEMMECAIAKFQNCKYRSGKYAWDHFECTEDDPD